MRKKQPRILLINTSMEWLHYLEFVKPIEDILKNEGEGYFVRDYIDLDKKDLDKASKIIICGTAISDFEYLNQIKKFEIIKKFTKPILGICAGMQIIGALEGVKFDQNYRVGMEKIKIDKEILGMKKNEEKEVYCLHKYTLNKESTKKDFGIHAETKDAVHIIKHKKKEIYGTLFHPEVRNKEIIINFAKK